MSKIDSIAVLLPCYNEAITIGKVVEDFKRELPQATIYVYDNNSTDNTTEIAQKAGAVVRHESQQGKGNVIRRMFREIDAQVYLMADGDDTYPADHARDLIDKVLIEKADMVIGDRLSSTYSQENDRPFHNFGNNLVRGLINALFNNDVKDIMTGYRAFSYEFVKTFPVVSDGFEIETEMTIHSLEHKLSIETVKVDYRDRPEGSESKLNTFRDGFKVLKTIFNLFKNHKPFIFFTVLSLILLLVAILLLLPVFIEFRSTGLVERFPTLMVGGFIGLTAILTFIAGIILDLLLTEEKKSFQIHYHQAINNRRTLFAPMINCNSKQLNEKEDDR